MQRSEYAKRGCGSQVAENWPSCVLPASWKEGWAPRVGGTVRARAPSLPACPPAPVPGWARGQEGPGSPELPWGGHAWTRETCTRGTQCFRSLTITASVFSDLQSLTEDPEDETVPSDFSQKCLQASGPGLAMGRSRLPRTHSVGQACMCVWRARQGLEPPWKLLCVEGHTATPPFSGSVFRGRTLAWCMLLDDSFLWA